MSQNKRQDKQQEIALFDGLAAIDDYSVFTPDASARLVDAFVESSGLSPGARVADLGCGSGAFTALLARKGYECVGLDISAKLIAVGRRRHPGIEFVAGDIERLPFADASFDGVFLGGVVHHFPDPSRCAAEVGRVLRPQGRFVAFDPNRRNPFMWLYRDRSSPFYSPLGVTANERPVLAGETAAAFERAGFAVSSHYLAGLAYRYVASPRARPLLPIYNAVDAAVFGLPFMERLRPFVLTAGVKPPSHPSPAPARLQHQPAKTGVSALMSATRYAGEGREGVMTPELDIVIPVYNEGRNIVATLTALARAVTTPARVLICYDHAEDDTLPAIRDNPQPGLVVELVRNTGRGAHGAIMTGFAASTAPFILMYPADDDTNAPMLDRMVALARDGCDIVCASRFIPGGAMVGCPWLKATLVRTANFTLRHVARLPSTDASNGFRLFSRRVIDGIAIESDRGFCYSIELLVKAHRLGWRVGEVPVRWFERRHGESRFRVLRWLPAYLRWYGYAFATTWLRRPPSTVTLKGASR